MEVRVAHGSMQAAFVGGNQKQRRSRADVVRSTQKLAPIINSAREQRWRQQLALATPPKQPILVAPVDELADAEQSVLPLRVDPSSLQIENGHEVTLSLDVDPATIGVVEWRAYTPSTDEERIVRNQRVSMTDAPVADTVYNVLFQVHEPLDRLKSRRTVLVGHHYEVYVSVLDA